MILVTKQLKRVFGEDNKTTETTALLVSPYLTYAYGIALPLYWAAGQSTMICAFGWLAIHAKRKVPNAHTLLEIIRARYGTPAHVLWIVLCLINNLLIFSQMIVGVAASVTSLTGMDTVAASYLLPLGVVIYTYFGGIRATFLTDYVHTFIIMIVTVWFTIKLITMEDIGSIGALYDLVKPLSDKYPVAGNYRGSYLTMTSKECIFFGIIHTTANTAIVFLDTGFWQKASILGFAADIPAAVPGYVLGGNAYFAIPFAFGTIMGLGALALEQTPAFPTYPRRMTQEEVFSGLVLPYVSQAIAGKGGAVAVLLIVFMACTSISSAQLIAMSSIFSFDIYGTYINKRATNAQLIKWSHIGVVGSALLISTLSTALYKGGVDLNWLLYFLGILICPGMFPTVLALVWKRQPRIAAIIAPIVGFAAGVSVWVGTAYAYSGEATIKSLGQTLPCLFGNMTSFFVPLPITLVISYIWPEPNFEWSDLLSIKRIEDNEHGKVGTTASHFNAETYFTSERVAYMKRMSRIALYWGIATFAGQWVLWPLPMYGARFIFGKKASKREESSGATTPTHNDSPDGSVSQEVVLPEKA
ncbi:MAG: hypothetical protein Q9195_007379 [Heterodermia aff. obscurata]